MKSKMRKKLIAFMLCMVLVICNSVSILADAPAAATTTTEKQVKETGTAKSEGASKEEQSADDEKDTSEQSDEESAPETETTEKKEETTEATTEDKEDATTATTTKAKEETTEATETSDKDETTGAEDDSDKKDETSETSEEETSETSEETTETTEETLEETADKITFEQTVDGVKIIVTAENEDVLPADAVLSVTKITSDTELQKMEDAVAEDIVANETTIKDMMAFDIKFMQNGTEIQPNGTVTVAFENTGYEAENGISVYHVDDAAQNATDMSATTDTEADVQFETTHFSNYVIINNGEGEVNVKIEHYLKQDGQEPIKLYRDFEKTFETGTEENRISNFTKEDDDYRLDSIVKIESDKEVPINATDIIVESDATFRCYYTANTGTYENGVTFFDYENGGVYDSNSINYWGNYSGGYDTGTYNNRLGTIGAADTYKLMVNQSVEVNGTTQTARFNANAYWRVNSDSSNGVGAGNGDDANYTRDENCAGNNNGFSWPILKGLINGLNGDNYEHVDFDCDEPGFFSAESKAGKTIYDDKYDYTLHFDKNGNRYTLSSVKEKGNTVVGDLGNFFPLNNKNNNQKNEYFGMRYDFTFSVGDYLGDMTYSFTGDDDLWVFVDGDLVLDLGGIHGAYQGSEYNDLTNSLWPTEVDIWEYLTKKTDYTAEDKLAVNPDEKHTVTVLYMERGGEKSNCHMEFVMPNVQASDPVISTTPKAKLELKKVDAETKQGLKGAEFTLYSDKQCTEESVIGTATSGDDGTVTFNNQLKEGTYYLKETVPPDTYMSTSEIYTVTVEVSGDSATATITNSNGNEISDNTITNTQIEKALEKHKTAQVTNWDNRTYRIDLDASSILKKPIEGSTKAVDVMLVLDASGSMCEYSGTLDGELVSKSQAEKNNNGQYYYFERDGELYRAVYEYHWSWSGGSYDWTVERENGSNSGRQSWRTSSQTVTDATNLYTDFVSRNEAMQEAANEFVTLLAEQSPDSRVGIAAYSNNLRASLLLTEVGGNGINTIQNKINSIGAYSSTYAYYGLDYARQQFQNSNSENDKIVVLLSDGNDNGEQPARTVANTLKENDVTIYSVGFHVNENARTFLETVASGSDHYYSADSMEELVKSFKLILEDSFEGVTFENVTIVDVIDSRFNVVDENGTVLGEGATIEDNNKNLGTLKKKKSSGEWYVEWTNVTVAPKASEGGTPGWSATIYIKAKDDYIGGNDVATNGDGSGITFSGNYVPFGKPHVNVKAELTVSDKAITIYKGDSAPTKEDILQKMFGIDNITKYEGVDEEDFTLKWYDEDGGVVNQLPVNPTEDQTFHLEVTYDAGKPSNESNANTTLGNQTYFAGEQKQDGTYIVTAINSDNPQLDYAVYDITVISGHLVIKKTLEEAAGSDQTFNFTITKDGQAFSPSPNASIKIPEGATEGTWTVDGLARGTYVITEDSAPGYSLQDVAIDDETNAQSNVPDTKDSATIILGNSTGGQDVIEDYTYNEADGGTKGIVNFTNTSVMDNWQIVKRNKNNTTELLDGAKFTLTSTDDRTTYYGLSNTSGVVEWYSDPECSTSAQLKRGEYRLEEIAAPSGYVLSEVEWTVKIAKNGRLSWIKENEKELSPVEQGNTYVFYYENVMLYELPSAGGPGIYWYTLGGTLLMAGAALIVYRQKRKREMLLKK